MQLSTLGLAEDPNRPAFSALCLACVQNINAAFEVVSRACSLPPDDPTTPSAVKEALALGAQHLQDSNELFDWVYPPRKALTFEAAFNHAKSLTGLQADFVEGFLSQLQKRPVGRPHKRNIYIKAFELQLQSAKMSLGQVTRKLCPCGKTQHEPKCEQIMKAGIRSLKPLLRRYAPDLIARYNSLHPDRTSLGNHRAKKVNG